MEPEAVGQVLEKLKHSRHLKRNRDPGFVGIQALKDKQRWQLGKFQQAAACDDWVAIHRDHYDWWMFPIDEKSMYGLAWTVYEGDIADLKDDSQYLDCYLLGVELLARSWGWDVRQARYLSDLQPGQCWQNWPIRLYKAAKSVKLFGFGGEFRSLKALGQDLMKQGVKMYYRRDLSWLFRE
jgi:hypothetical protein